MSQTTARPSTPYKWTSAAAGNHSTFDATFAQIVADTCRTPTEHQTAIYRNIAEGNGHTIVNAVAGSGKTTTVIDSLRFIPPDRRALLVAFNKHIADELNRRDLPANATARTLHSVGMAACRQLHNRPQVDAGKMRAIFRAVSGYADATPAQRAIIWAMTPAALKVLSLLKNLGYGTQNEPFLRPLSSGSEIHAIANMYDIDLPEPQVMGSFIKYIHEANAESYRRTDVIDFDDMLAMPLYHGVTMPFYDFVFVDESQDLNPIQVEIVRRIVRDRGRAIFVGDRHQAIYGFRGADPAAIDNIANDFDATELPLSICWRCAASIIAEAQTIVPHIEASPTAAAGEVVSISADEWAQEVRDGDYVLSRCTEPLVEGCLALIRDGRKASVVGRDIGQALKALLEKADKLAGDNVRERITAYGDQQAAKLAGEDNEAKAQSMADRIATLKVLAEGCTDAAHVKRLIDQIFRDDVTGVAFSTVHKSKGLEADRVFILRPDLMPHPAAKQDWQKQQEANLEYVAITRAKSRLFWIIPNEGE